MATRKPKEPKEYKLSELDMYDAEQRKTVTEAVKAAVGALPCQLDASQIVEQAMRILRSEQSNALWVMLGMADKWGKWEFDNCNGRKGAIEDWIKAHCLDELGAFMKAELGEVLELKKEEFRKGIRAAILKDVDGIIKDISKTPWETKRAFESIQQETIKEVIKETREEIRAEVLRSMNIDPEKYKGKQDDRNR